VGTPFAAARDFIFKTLESKIKPDVSFRQQLVYYFYGLTKNGRFVFAAFPAHAAP